MMRVWMIMMMVMMVMMMVEGKAMNKSGRSLSHNNNWAVLVDTSRFWLNYRHAANVYSMYQIVRSLGIPDSNIILMVSDGMACEAQNPDPGAVYNDGGQSSKNIYGPHIQVDYRGTEVTAEALMRVLMGRHPPEVPNTKRLLSDEGSNVFIYLTGHGGDGFFKFQDAGDISSVDFADAFMAMHQKRRYHEMLVMVDTCQGGTLHEHLTAPNILMVGSSRKGQNAWSHGGSGYLGTTMMDQFTHSTLEFFLRNVQPGKPVPSMQRLVNSYDPVKLQSDPTWNNRLKRPLDQIPVTDFFGYSNASKIANDDSVRVFNIGASGTCSIERFAFAIQSNVGRDDEMEHGSGSTRVTAAVMAVGALVGMVALSVLGTENDKHSQ